MFGNLLSFPVSAAQEAVYASSDRLIAIGLKLPRTALDGIANRSSFPVPLLSFLSSLMFNLSFPLRCPYFTPQHLPFSAKS